MIGRMVAGGRPLPFEIFGQIDPPFLGLIAHRFYRAGWNAGTV